MNILTIISAIVAVLSVTVQAGLYPKSSPVLQITGKTFPKLVEKSSYTSIVEFYAPWCGHCQNLKPAYEKAAKSLEGLAQVAAVNCDDDDNKPLCGQMGVQGFPTLKIVRPAKKHGGSPIIEDYRGERSAKAIAAAVTSNINNHVTRVTDKEIDSFMSKEGPKALLFTEKGTISATLKAIAIDFLDVISIGQVRNKEEETVVRFGINSFPSLIFFPSKDADPVFYDGEMKKAAIVKFLSQAGAASHTAGIPTTGKSKSKEKASMSPLSSTQSKENSQSSEAATVKETINLDPGQPGGATLRVLTDAQELSRICLSPKSHTCVLAFTSTDKLDERTTIMLNNLAEVYQRHKHVNQKLFETFIVPESNTSGNMVRERLMLQRSLELIAINGKRGWWRHFPISDDVAKGVEDISHNKIETWFDAIRMGEGKKHRMPPGVILEDIKEDLKMGQPEKIRSLTKAEDSDIIAEETNEPDAIRAPDEGGQAKILSHEEL